MRPRIYGYGRMSTSKQVESPESQRRMIEVKAATLADVADWRYTRCDEATSAYKTRWNERPEFRKLMDELQPGDHLIVWRLDRLERSMWGMIRCVEWLNRRGVVLHVLQYGGAALDLDTAMGKITLSLWAGFAELFSEQLSQTIREQIQSAKDRGLPWGNTPALGKKRKRRTDGRRGILEEFWDEEQCDYIREMWSRYAAGEPISKIMLDFEERGCRTWDGSLWSPRSTRYRRDISHHKITRAIWLRTEMLADGRDLGDVPVPPELQEQAVQMLADREKRRRGKRAAIEANAAVRAEASLSDGGGLRRARRRKRAKRRSRAKPRAKVQVDTGNGSVK